MHVAGGSKRWVGLLRAVNVGGTGLLRMSDLRNHMERLGLSDVSTYIQSGNVIFTDPSGSSRDELATRLQAQLGAALGNPAVVLVRSRADLEEAAGNNPFEPDRRDSEQACHLMFLSATPDPARSRDLLARAGDDLRLAIRDAVLYIAYPRSLAGSRRTVNYERLLGVTGTARTWKVVDKLIELSS